MDEARISEIRSATFSLARKGYDTEEVRRYLDELAGRLENEEPSRPGSQAVRRELELVGEKTANLLAQAEESAERMHAEAVREASTVLSKSREDAAGAREAADDYATQARAEADRYAEQVRAAAEEDARVIRGNATAEVQDAAERAVEDARRQAEETGENRDELEAQLAELGRRRDEILTDLAGVAGDLQRMLSRGPAEAGVDQPETVAANLEPPAGEVVAAAPAPDSA